MKLKFALAVCIVCVLFNAAPLLAQRPETDKPEMADTAKAGPRTPNNKPRPYNEVITSKATTANGMFKVHTIADKFFFEIPDSMLRREILVVNRISKAPAGARTTGLGYAGDDIGQNVIWFEKGPNDKIFLRTISFAEYARDSTAPMFTTVNNSNIQPIEAAFDIKAYSKEGRGSVIDVTDFVNGDNGVSFLSDRVKRRAGLSAVQKDKSYVVSVRSFPINIEITAVKTYGSSPTAATAGNITLELNSSMVMLPKKPMQARYADARVGFFTVGYTDFDINPQGVQRINLIKRWRLEPKDEDIEKYKRGELVEPKNPIIFYIDPATPAKWIPYLMQGVTDWQMAFEQAGFKNAIFGKRAPTKAENPDWSLEDSRYSAIVYKPSTTPNASGPSIADPRSGEIMESHINWYHNVMSLVRNWYFVQAAPVDARARQMIFDDTLMGELIRFVSSHEVGHTLGLRHNFGSSSAVPVEMLRNKAWVEANGHTPSIMDYARFNYVAQPEDNITDKGIFPRIGDYDKWAIEFGYRQMYQYNSADEEKTAMNKIVMEKMKNKRLWFGDGESNSDDPRNQSEQVGDDAVKGSMYGIKNLKRIIPNLTAWTKMPNEDFSSLNTMYGQVTSQFSRYNNHVLRSVGGIMKTPKTTEEPGVVFEIVPRLQQKEAIDYLNKNLFATPEWLINNDIFAKIGTNGLKEIGALQDDILSDMLRAQTLNKVVAAEAFPGKDSYKITELLNDVTKGIFTELSQKKPVDIYRRQLQTMYVDKLHYILNPKPAPVIPAELARQFSITPVQTDFVDVQSTVRAQLETLRTEVKAAAILSTDRMTKIHLRDIANRIDKALDPKS